MFTPNHSRHRRLSNASPMDAVMTFLFILLFGAAVYYISLLGHPR